MFPRIDHPGQMIWRDIVPVVALALALVLTFWTRHYDDLAPYSYSAPITTAHSNHHTGPGYAGPVSSHLNGASVRRSISGST
jgi:hypothetical protein